MDRLESLATQLSQVTMYDIKSMYNQAKNIVLNVSEMEAKVREATNDDPWGASSTLMTEIAQGTFNFQHFNEIMPCIYARFMEKEASQWRQIYKALQLLEYIIKHGSERVVDDARSHLSTIKMLRNFRYIDDGGKDQGINVRNRAKELAELLSDVDRIRQERRKAKVNRNKYVGTGNDGLSFASASGGRYGGFGSESVGYGGGGSGSTGGYDNDYGGSSSRSGGFHDDGGRRGYEEYDAGDDEDTTTKATSPSSPVDHRRSESLSRANLGSVTLPRKGTDPAPTRTAAASKPTGKPATVMDLLGFDDEANNSASPVVSATTSAPSASLDDDFDDFQSATPVANSPPPIFSAAAPKPTGSANVFELLGGGAAGAPKATSVFASQPVPSRSPPSFNTQAPMSASTFTMKPTTVPTIQPQQSQSAFSTYNSPPKQQPMGMGMMSPISPTSGTANRPNYFGGPSMTAPKPATPPTTAKSSGAFDDLWSMGLGKPAAASKPASAANPNAGKSIKDIEREKQQAAIWGASSAGAPQRSFGGSAAAPSGADDLLL